jgi:hypothetical protein
MAAGTVVTVLSNIPWGQVVEAAPKIAESASRLWEAAKNFCRPKATSGETPNTSSPGQPTETDQLKARLAELESTTQELREQLRASSEVVKALADQNTLLVQRIEAARVRLARITFGGATCVAILSVAIVYLLATR